MNEKQSELKILLANVSMARAKEIAEKYPDFDIIQCTSEYNEASEKSVATIGKTMVLWIGQEGKSIGTIGYWKNAGTRFRFESVTMDKQFDFDPEVESVYASYVNRLMDSRLIDKIPKLPLSNSDEFVGASRCGTCHTKAYEIWKNTAHSHAMKTLIDEKPEGQHWNPECVTCHVVGLDHQSGFINVEQSLHLGDVQCESCHGPGKLHSNDPRNKQYLEAVRLPLGSAEKKCTECHDIENSINFDFKTYWEKIVHIGLN